MRVRVKICGITGIEDARMAVEAGADAVGLVLAESPRRIGLEAASGIAGALPPFVKPVGVFVNEPVAGILTTCRRIGISEVQLSGTEPAEDVAALRNNGLKVIKAIHVAPDGALSGEDGLGADAVLLDTRIGGLSGGTGLTFDTAPAKRLRFGVPVILAGGLTPENVAARIREIRPYAVDVSSGVEASPGKKDRGLIEDFIAAAISS